MGSDAVAPAPGETRYGVADGVVFAADPVGVAELADAAEDVFPADLAGAGFVAAGHVGGLHVVDHRHQRFEAPGYITLGGLAVVDVELQLEPVAADRPDDRGTLLLRAQQIAWARLACITYPRRKAPLGEEGAVVELKAP